MKLILAGTIATSLVIVASVLLVLPIYIPSEPPGLLMLSFDITKEHNLPTWCFELSHYLKQNQINAAVFLSGITAENFPECVNSFHNGIDVGSQTYTFVNLPKITDYSLQLEEVKNGKEAVDKVGNLDTKLFKAPYGSIDENIYSILHRSGIYADFSYQNQYNKYYEGQFIKFDTLSYNASQIDSIILEMKDVRKPIIINYDNTVSVSEIEKILDDLKSENIRFVNPSELTGLDLTQRRGMLF